MPYQYRLITAFLVKEWEWFRDAYLREEARKKSIENFKRKLLKLKSVPPVLDTTAAATQTAALSATQIQVNNFGVSKYFSP